MELRRRRATWPPWTRRRSQRVHAIRRARERYGVTLTERTLGEVERKIQTNGAHFLGRVTKAVSAFDVKYGGKTMRALYDKRRSCICTFVLRTMTLHYLTDEEAEFEDDDGGYDEER